MLVSSDRRRAAVTGTRPANFLDVVNLSFGLALELLVVMAPLTSEIRGVPLTAFQLELVEATGASCAVLS